MVFYSVEYVPENIRINALVLGSLTFLVAVLFFLEDCLISKQLTTINKLIQTETLVGYILLYYSVFFFNCYTLCFSETHFIGAPKKTRGQYSAYLCLNEQKSL